MPILDEKRMSTDLGVGFDDDPVDLSVYEKTSLVLGVNDLEFAEKVRQFRQKRNRFKGAPKQYLQCQTIPLRPDFSQVKDSLLEAFRQRQSRRVFKASPITFSALSTWLQMCYGTLNASSPPGEKRLRTVPSAGALYPLEIYLISFSVAELEPGLYHLNTISGDLEVLQSQFSADDMRRIKNAFPDYSQPSAGIVIGTVVFKKFYEKYGNRGWRFVLMEAGHVCQNAYLIASSLSIGCWTLGGVKDLLASSILKLDPLEEGHVFALSIGAL